MANAILTPEIWRDVIGPYHFPNQFADPLKRAYEDWKDPSNPLASLLEILKFTMCGPYFGVKPSVAGGQTFLESDMGRAQDTLLGAKATAKDRAAGNAKRMKTYEEFTQKEVDAVSAAGDLISVVKINPTTGKILIRCFQWFFFKPGLADDFDRYWSYYERREPTRTAWLHKSPEEFLKNVTVGPPWKYATDPNYTSLVMGKITKYNLTALDCVIV